MAFFSLQTQVLKKYVFAGFSGLMEVEAAGVSWRRSVERHKLRYITLLSDGDAKTLTELKRIKPYFEDVLLEKEECINHISRRLGSALRNVVTDCRKRGVKLGGGGGGGKGQLTQIAIRKFAIYYSRVIRRNRSVDTMKEAVMVSLIHCFVLQMKGLDMSCVLQERILGKFFSTSSR